MSSLCAGKSLARDCGRVAEPGRGLVARGRKPAAGSHHFGARLVACARRARALTAAACGQPTGSRMTSDLLLARDCIICWVTVWLAPVECMFDMIESELIRRGVELEGATRPALPAA